MPNSAQWNPQKNKWNISFRGVKNRDSIALVVLAPIVSVYRSPYIFSFYKQSLSNPPQVDGN